MKSIKYVIKKYMIKIVSKLFNLMERAYQSNIYNGYMNKYNIHPSFVFNGNGTLIYGEGTITIDEHSYIGRYSLIQVSKNYQVSIGKNCKIGPFFSAWTQSSYVDHDYNFEDKIEPKIGNIIIGDAVWIGANVIISPGVTIGENSVIGANSVVTKDVPPMAVVGGVPAKIIRYKKLENIK